MRIIPAKFGQNPASSLGGGVRQHTMDEGHPAITIETICIKVCLFSYR